MRNRTKKPNARFKVHRTRGRLHRRSLWPFARDNQLQCRESAEQRGENLEQEGGPLRLLKPSHKEEEVFLLPRGRKEFLGDPWRDCSFNWKVETLSQNLARVLADRYVPR